MARMDNILPQRYLVQVVHQTNDGITVERVPVENGAGSLPITVGNGETVTVVISGITPVTTEPAGYRFTLN